MFVEWTNESDIKAGGRKAVAVHAMSIHATCDIEPGTELTLHYGSEYGRDYEVGKPPLKGCTKAKIRDALETPAAWLGDCVRKDAYRL